MSVRLVLEPLVKFEKAIMDGLRSTAPNPVRTAFKRIAMYYRSWAMERFTTYSRGGGDWAPLSPSTIRSRRKGKARNLTIQREGKSEEKTVKEGTVSILWDTGTMRGGLDPTFSPSKGAVEDQIPFGVRVGMGGGGRHPKSKDLTIGDIANVHQAGAPGLPPRPIIVEPPLTEQVHYVVEIASAIDVSWQKATG